MKIKRNLFLGIALLLLTAGCNNNENIDNGEGNGKINLTKAVKFTVSFADYNEAQEVNVTRAGNNAGKDEKLAPQAVELGNGLVALCTLQRDTAKQKDQVRTTTRTIPNDTYTMLAYDATTHAFKGETTGTVQWGSVFTLAPGKSAILLNPGTYDFVLYNSKVSRSGNNLTVNRTDANQAYIGRTTQTITATPQRQEVPFTMKHIDARVKVQLTTYARIQNVNADLMSTGSNVPNSSVYDAANGIWSIGSSSYVSENTTYSNGYPSSPTNIATCQCSENLTFMPGTNVSNLGLLFTGGTMYEQSLSGTGLTFHPTSTLKLEAGGAYVLNVKLMYNYLYLMTDGTTGPLTATTYAGGTKTPIAAVLSQSKRMAMALNPASNPSAWCISAYNSVTTNTHAATDYLAAISTETTDGYDETWDPSYTTAAVSGNKVKGENPDFPPIYAAAHYNPGVSYTGTPNVKWYLPSYNDWKWVYSAIGKGNISDITYTFHNFPCKGYLADVICCQVGGTKMTNRWFWTSSELANNYGMPYIKMNYDGVDWAHGSKTGWETWNGAWAFTKY